LTTDQRTSQYVMGALCAAPVGPSDRYPPSLPPTPQLTRQLDSQADRLIGSELVVRDAADVRPHALQLYLEPLVPAHQVLQAPDEGLPFGGEPGEG